jgi:hypothetical protein
MQTNNKSDSNVTTATAPPPSSAAGCSPCEIPGFCRSYFYTGKLLTEGDLNREQRYLIEKLRLHHAALHGWGVVCGLVVRPHPDCPDRFVVTPGLAIDDCGREVRLVKECITFFPKPVKPAPDPCPPDPCDEGNAEEKPPHGPRPQTYYVCIKYNECQEDFMPVIFDDCCGTTTKPNRVCECATIELLVEPPECLKKIHERCGCKQENCHKMWEHFPGCCPPMGEVCCIPLAVIRDYTYCEPLLERMIDNSIRPVLRSTERLDELVHCLVDKLPHLERRLTHISRYNWDHDGEYSPHEFMREFIGTQDAPRGFEIEFDARVQHKGLNNRTFQAAIVREPGGPHEPRRFEVAPGRVVRSEDGHRCALHVDHEFARHHLHDHSFDLYITLRCDKVIDERGLAVDGDLLATRLEDEERDYIIKHPSGNGIPGGLFESWIRVRRER